MGSIGERVKYLRSSHEMTLLDVASVLEMSQSTLSYIENNKHDMSIFILAKLSKFFNVSCDWILTGDEGNETKIYAELVALRTKFSAIEKLVNK